MGQPWFRYHVAVIHNPRVRRLTDRLFRIWVNLMCIVCLEGDDKTGKLPPIEDCADLLRETLDETKVAFHALVEAGLIVTVNETFHINNWKEKQYKSDSSTDRVRRHRNAHKTVTVTAPDTEQNTDTEQIPPTPQNGGSEPSKISARERAGYDILAKITEHGRDRARNAAPGWDLHTLAESYNRKIRSGQADPPYCPNLAFEAYAKAAYENQRKKKT